MLKKIVKYTIGILGYELKKKNKTPIKGLDRMKKTQVIGCYPASVLRSQQNDILKDTITYLPNIKTVINIGALPYEGDKQGSKYADYFNDDVEFYTLDKNREDNTSSRHFNIDLHDLTAIGKKFDLVLCMSTVEHVEQPFEVCKQISDIVAPGGYLFFCTPFFFPIHKDIKGRYSDYWRFTDDGIRILFRNMDEVWIKEIDSVIVTVEDRNIYWDDRHTTVSGYCALFKLK
ncbi:MAG TPA: methyltransferase domain-containing protein [Selenomonadales bacterium]|nr:methyltransferase domain-containing protein [Selenomonadales bacterium]